ncbi:MAG: tRNA pseudouridine(55) synthase TruB [Eubacteriales bacterium]|nr:tRNA pseudouridine(55) synthase TruB [Eubacteriales bacterium]
MSVEQKQYCGFLNVLKPPGMSSAQVVGYVRWLMDGAKIGHGGTLDPEAAGVLPLMVGKAARLFDYMQDKEKAYVTEVAFGTATDTQDAQGTVINSGNRYPDEKQICDALAAFTGTVLQQPPMYSALKQNGKRLYQLARSGQTAEVPKREVVVHSLQFGGMTEDHGALLTVRCSKGFYVRTLCHDLGAALDCPAHMRFLLRIQSGVFTLSTAVTLEKLREAKEAGRLENLLLPPEAVLEHLPHADTPPGFADAVRNGGRLPISAFQARNGKEVEDGKPLCLWLDGKLCAVMRREGNQLKPHTWLGE